MFREFARCLFVAVCCSVLAPLVAGLLFRCGLTGGIVVAPLKVHLSNARYNVTTTGREPADNMMGYRAAQA